jgi:hypothetical protein
MIESGLAPERVSVTRSTFRSGTGLAMTLS